jgi:hypothetical protein
VRALVLRHRLSFRDLAEMMAERWLYLSRPFCAKVVRTLSLLTTVRLRIEPFA